MHLKPGFMMREVAGQHVAIATGEASNSFHGMIKLNETGAAIWQGISDGLDIDQIARSLADQYDVELAKAQADVAAFAAKLEQAGILER